MSWAEFLAEEPVQPSGRNSKGKPSSLFEWALSAKQEREKALGGRGAVGLYVKGGGRRCIFDCFPWLPM